MDEKQLKDNESKIEIHIPTQLKNRFKDKCALAGISMRGFLIRVITQYVIIKEEEFWLWSRLEKNEAKRILEENDHIEKIE